MTEFDIRADSLATYRIAKARGMAERSRIAHYLWAAAVRSVRDLLTPARNREEA